MTVKQPGTEKTDDENRLRDLIFRDFSTEYIVEQALKEYDPNYLGAFGEKEAVLAYLRKFSSLYGLRISENFLEIVTEETLEWRNTRISGNARMQNS